MQFDELANGLDRASVIPELVRAISEPLKLIAVSGAREHFQTGVGPDGKPWKPLAHDRPEGAGRPLLDKGLLAASMRASTNQTGETLNLDLTASHPGATLQQFGGIVKPVRGEWLSIPVTVEAKRTGSPRRFPRGLFFVLAKSPETGLLCEVGADGNIKVQYVLKHSVSVSARMFVGFSQKTQDKITRLAADKYAEIVARRLQDAGSK
jgi:hypothetical protein